MRTGLSLAGRSGHNGCQMAAVCMACTCLNACGASDLGLRLKAWRCLTAPPHYQQIECAHYHARVVKLWRAESAHLAVHVSTLQQCDQNATCMRYFGCTSMLIVLPANTLQTQCNSDRTHHFFFGSLNRTPESFTIGFDAGEDNARTPNLAQQT